MEDDYDIAALLRLNLQDEGYQIVHEADGARARLLLDKQTWDWKWGLMTIYRNPFPFLS